MRVDTAQIIRLGFVPLAPVRSPVVFGGDTLEATIDELHHLRGTFLASGSGAGKALGCIVSIVANLYWTRHIRGPRDDGGEDRNVPTLHHREPDVVLKKQGADSRAQFEYRCRILDGREYQRLGDVSDPCKEATGR